MANYNILLNTSTFSNFEKDFWIFMVLPIFSLSSDKCFTSDKCFSAVATWLALSRLRINQEGEIFVNRSRVLKQLTCTYIFLYSKILCAVILKKYLQKKISFNLFFNFVAKLGIVCFSTSILFCRLLLGKMVLSKLVCERINQLLWSWSANVTPDLCLLSTMLMASVE